mmetsp:Transcript_11036/g.33792  ORF Transcript_11036/g.33792 Transcript_11036/m.33792 type:complete len:302 (-) Transcript_11036:488-1393(-)
MNGTRLSGGAQLLEYATPGSQLIRTVLGGVLQLGSAAHTGSAEHGEGHRVATKLRLDAALTCLLLHGQLGLDPAATLLAPRLLLLDRLLLLLAARLLGAGIVLRVAALHDGIHQLAIHVGELAAVRLEEGLQREREGGGVGAQSLALKAANRVARLLLASCALSLVAPCRGRSVGRRSEQCVQRGRMGGRWCQCGVSIAQLRCALRQTAHTLEQRDSTGRQRRGARLQKRHRETRTAGQHRKGGRGHTVTVSSLQALVGSVRKALHRTLQRAVGGLPHLQCEFLLLLLLLLLLFLLVVVRL